MNYHRGLLFWGLALITGGAVALAAQQGYIDSHALAGAWRLWPLILIAIGVSILASRTPFAIVGTIVAALVVGAAGGALIAVGPGVAACGGPDPTNLTTRHGSLGREASVDLEFNCGKLEVGMADGSDWTVASAQQGGPGAVISADSTHLAVRSGSSNNWFDNLGRDHWIVSLPTAATNQLDISPNAAESRVDLGAGSFSSISIHPNAGSLFLNLANASFKELDLAVNAGSASVVIGANPNGQTGVRSASMHVNAGSIELCMTGDVALQVTSDPNITFSTNLDESGLVKTGDSWSTAGYDDAFLVRDRVQIQLDGNAGSFTLNPEGGCS